MAAHITHFEICFFINDQIMIHYELVIILQKKHVKYNENNIQNAYIEKKKTKHKLQREQDRRKKTHTFPY